MEQACFAEEVEKEHILKSMAQKVPPYSSFSPSGIATGFIQSLFTPKFFRQLQQLRISSRKTFLGSRQGSHLSARRGHGLEFADYRPYAPGDDFRHIDWNVLSRTDRLYVRQFREEQDLPILIDASASVGASQAGLKFDLLRALSLSLALIGLADGDTVRLSLLGQETLPRQIGIQSFQKLRNRLLRVHPKGSFSILQEARKVTSIHRTPGPCFILSDFFLDLDELFQALKLLRGRNFDITLIQVLSKEERTLDIQFAENILIDAESGERIELALNEQSVVEYQDLLWKHNRAIEEFCERMGVRFLSIDEDADPNRIVLETFPAKKIIE
jgi:uncharacterized protein (DUF58 family)